MSKRKGVSAEDKKSRILEIFYEKKEFFQLKDLERIAPKEKGVIANSVKEVVQKLVDDGLIDTDKIGGSIYFWSFPSKALGTRKRKLDDLTLQHEQASKRLKINEESLELLIDGREDSSERNKVLDQIMDFEIKLCSLKSELKQYQDNDPEVFRKMKEDIKAYKEAANRWTDNLFAVKSWCKNKFNAEDSVIDKQFGIPSNFDYIE